MRINAYNNYSWPHVYGGFISLSLSGTWFLLFRNFFTLYFVSYLNLKNIKWLRCKKIQLILFLFKIQCFIRWLLKRVPSHSLCGDYLLVAPENSQCSMKWTELIWLAHHVLRMSLQTLALQATIMSLFKSKSHRFLFQMWQDLSLITDFNLVCLGLFSSHVCSLEKKKHTLWYIVQAINTINILYNVYESLSTPRKEKLDLGSILWYTIMYRQ